MAKMEYKFTAPLFIRMGKKKPKNYWLTLNNYRNWHFQVSNNVKKLFKETVAIPKKECAIKEKVTITYTFYYPNLMKRDIGNSLAVIDKFFADALVESNWLEDDNYEFVNKIIGKFGGIDKENPRVEIELKTP